MEVNIINDCKNCIERANFRELKAKLNRLKEIFIGSETEISTFIYEINDNLSAEIKYGFKDNAKVNSLMHRILNFLSDLKESGKQ